MKARLSGVVAGVVLALLIGCSSMVTPKGFEQKLAYAYGMHTTAMESAATLVLAGKISKEQGVGLLKLSDQSRVALDVARVAAKGGDAITAEEKLALASKLINTVLEYVEDNQGRVK